MTIVVKQPSNKKFSGGGLVSTEDQKLSATRDLSQKV